MYAKLDCRLFTGSLAVAIREHPDEDLRPLLWAVATYLIGCESRSSIGLYRLSIATIADDLGSSIDRVSIAVETLIEHRFCSYDRRYRVVFVREAARHQWGKSPNVAAKTVKGLISRLPEILGTVRKSPAFRDFLAEYGEDWSEILDAAGIDVRSTIDRRSIDDRSKVEVEVEVEVEKKTEEGEGSVAPAPSRPRSPREDEIADLLEYWNTTARPRMKYILGAAKPPPSVAMTASARKALAGALRAGYAPEDVRRAMWNAAHDAWLMGAAGNGAAKADLPTVLLIRPGGSKPHDRVGLLLEKDRPDPGFDTTASMRRQQWDAQHEAEAMAAGGVASSAKEAD